LESSMQRVEKLLLERHLQQADVQVRTVSQMLPDDFITTGRISKLSVPSVDTTDKKHWHRPTEVSNDWSVFGDKAFGRPTEGNTQTLKRRDSHTLTPSLGFGQSPKRQTTPKGAKGKRNSELAIVCDDLQQFEDKSTRPNWMKSLVRTMRVWLQWWDDQQEPRREGCLADLVKRKSFEVTFGCVIVIHAVLMTYTIDQEMMNLGTRKFDFLDWIFMVIYCIELGMRLAVHQWFFFIGEGYIWNIFDTALVVASLYLNFVPVLLNEETMDVTFVQSLRLMKIVRVFRVLRVIRIFPGLEIIMNFVIRSGLSLAWCFATLAFFFYIFGLTLVQDLTVSMTNHSDQEMVRSVRDIFGSVPLAMFTLFRSVYGGEDWDSYYSVIKQADPQAAFCFVVFICFVQVSLFNVITVTFILHAQKFTAQSKQTKANEEILKHHEQYGEIERLCLKLDIDRSNTISREELHCGLENDQLRSEFMLCGLDIHDAQDFFELLLESSSDNEVDVQTFVEACMRMKGVASGIDQHTQLLEARRFQRSMVEHFFTMRHFQTEVIQKLDAVGVLFAPTAGNRQPVAF